MNPTSEHTPAPAPRTSEAPAPKRLSSLRVFAVCALLSAALSIPCSNLYAQDIHFSMPDLDPLIFNPAYSGFFDAAGRFGLLYRNQWATVSTPFQTIAATAELPILRNRQHRNGLNGGLCLTADRAGSLAYGSTSLSAIGSYFHGLLDGKNIFSFAVEGGIAQAGFSQENIVLSDRSESFDNTQTVYPTLGLGLAWFSQISEELYTKLGISLRNINQPRISYLDLANSSRLNTHFNIYTRAEWRFNTSWAALPIVAYQHQGRYSELLYGCDFKWYYSETPRSKLSFTAGIIGRHADAATIDFSVCWQSWTFALAYDANISKLSSASHTIGAFEVGIIYLLSNKDERFRHSALPCPIM